MTIKQNIFKQALKGDKPLFGLWMGIPDTTVAEIGAGAGFDWVLIDSEHGPFDLQSIMAHLQAIAAYPVAPLVCSVEGDTALIKQLLDIGAQTLLIPMIDTAEQAKQVVRAAHYPPAGIRGLGTSMARAANWNRTTDYLHQANDEICVIVQIETLAGLENIEAIAAVPGVDAVFIGPSDLAASMGYIGQLNHPKVVEAVEQGFSAIINAGKYPGVLAVNDDLVARYLTAGAKFIGVGVDTSLLVNATQQLAANYIKSTKPKKSAGY